MAPLAIGPCIETCISHHFWNHSFFKKNMFPLQPTWGVQAAPPFVGPQNPLHPLGLSADPNAFLKLCREHSDCASAEQPGTLAGHMGWVQRGEQELVMEDARLRVGWSCLDHCFELISFVFLFCLDSEWSSLPEKLLGAFCGSICSLVVCWAITSFCVCLGKALLFEGYGRWSLLLQNLGLEVSSTQHLAEEAAFALGINEFGDLVSWTKASPFSLERCVGVRKA